MIHQIKIGEGKSEDQKQLLYYLRRPVSSAKTYFYSMILSTSFFLTGCAHTTINNPYTQNNIQQTSTSNILGNDGAYYKNTNSKLTVGDNLSEIYRYAIYDQQESIVFTKHCNTMSANVVAVIQHNKNLLSYMYLINAVTDKKWWYQYGIYYNKFSKTGDNGIDITVNVYDSKGILRDFEVIQPKVPINPNNTVNLSMHISNSNVVMNALDLNNGSDVKYTQKLYGSKFLSGQFDCNNGAIFTGLMSEMYHIGYAYQVAENPVTFTSSKINYYKLAIEEDVLISGLSKYNNGHNTIILLGDSSKTINVKTYVPKPNQNLKITGITKIQFIGSKIPVILNPAMHQITVGGN